LGRFSKKEIQAQADRKKKLLTNNQISHLVGGESGQPYQTQKEKEPPKAVPWKKKKRGSKKSPHWGGEGETQTLNRNTKARCDSHVRESRFRVVKKKKKKGPLKKKKKTQYFMDLVAWGVPTSKKL